MYRLTLRGFFLIRLFYTNNPRPNHGIRRILPWSEVIKNLKGFSKGLLPQTMVKFCVYRGFGGGVGGGGGLFLF